MSLLALDTVLHTEHPQGLRLGGIKGVGWGGGGKGERKDMWVGVSGL